MSVAVKKKSEPCADTERQAQPVEEQFGFAPTRISQEDWDMLMEVMENPPKPNAALRAARAKYSRYKG